MRIKGLDAVRSYAIFLVLITHLDFFSYLPKFSGSTFFYDLFSGETGVRFFFALSGFLITHLLTLERIKYSRISIQKFLIRRFLRIFPPYYLFLLAVYILDAAGDLRAQGHMLKYAVLYIANFAPIRLYTGELGHTWSLSVEEHFYLIWPFLFSYISSKNEKAKLNYFLLVLFFIYIFHIGIALFFKSEYYINRWTLSASGSIFLGCLFAIFINSIGKWFPRFTLLKMAFLLYGSLFFVLQLKFDYPFANLIRALVASLFIAWIFLNQHSSICHFLENKAFVFIGKLSYGIYLWQGLFIRTGPGGGTWYQQFPQNLLLTLLVAFVSFKAFEEPILRLKRFFKQF